MLDRCIDMCGALAVTWCMLCCSNKLWRLLDPAGQQVLMDILESQHLLDERIAVELAQVSNAPEICVPVCSSKQMQRGLAIATLFSNGFICCIVCCITSPLLRQQIGKHMQGIGYWQRERLLCSCMLEHSAAQTLHPQSQQAGLTGEAAMPQHKQPTHFNPGFTLAEVLDAHERKSFDYRVSSAAGLLLHALLCEQLARMLMLLHDDPPASERVQSLLEWHRPQSAVASTVWT